MVVRQVYNTTSASITAPSEALVMLPVNHEFTLRA
jgi:hypothetical protein